MVLTPTIQRTCNRTIFSLISASFLISSQSIAQETEKPSVWARTKTVLGTIVEQHEWDVYLSGYAYHSRSTYSEERLKELNEKAWGAGMGKTFRNQKGNDESLYFMAIRDSHRHPQYMAGYTYQWIHPIIAGTKIEVGGGMTALLMRRVGWWGGAPFPAILPVVSIGTPGAKLMATFVPHTSSRKGKGNVVLLFAKFEF
jgi:hypothetical protein